MIELRGISKAFNKQPVLQAVSVVLPDVGIVALHGGSGSGKTTLLRILAELENADCGEIAGIGSKRVSYVFQEDRLLPHATTLENAAIASDNACARQWLERFGLGDSFDKKPMVLSGGMRRRVAIARAFAFGGNVLLLDEPFTGLDAGNVAVLKKEITRFAQTGLVILVHHGEDVLPAYDMRLTLENGQLQSVI
ncbi:MAG: ATP-binding cassette domain-containing protein [Oscillospiraceae bacterium]|jgi:NitT/TauT family transport system ATP-binding protein|nr:ATP-binding cassette domain-containing protein [Oscillospiraceae bacterium]